MDCKKTVGLLSGRFDPIHAGHIANILKLGNIHRMLYVVILDYPERNYPAQYIQWVLNEILKYAKGRYCVLINTVHFGKMTKEELAKLPKFDVYYAGNMEVLKTMTKLCKVKWLNRFGDFHATDNRIANMAKDFVKEITK